MRPATPAATKCRAQAWARNTLPRVFTPSVRSHCSGVMLEERRGRQSPGRADEDVEAAVRAHHLGDERLRALDLREVGGMRRGGVAEPSTAASSSPPGRSTHATRAPAATNASAQAKPIPRCAPVTSATFTPRSSVT